MSLSEAATPSNVFSLHGGSPSMHGGSPSSTLDGPEVVRRQAEWERQIESLDKKEVELHQCQLRLIREQHATFVREFKALRIEVDGLKRNQEEDREAFGLSHGQLTQTKEAHASVIDRLKYLEKLAGDSADRHEKHGRDLQELKGPHQAVTERLGKLDRLVSDVLDKHGKELKDLQDSHSKCLQDLEGVRGPVDGHGREVQNLKSLLSRHDASHAQHTADLERLRGDFERQLSDHSDRHLREVQALRDAHAGHGKDLADLANSKQELESLKLSHERYAKDLSGVKTAHEKHAKDLSSIKSFHASSDTIGERLDYLEKVIGDSAERHSQDWQNLREMHAKHAKEIVGIKASHAHHATLEERLTYIEKSLGDSVEKHAGEVEAMKAAHSKSSSELIRHSKTVEAMTGQHASLKEHVEYLERMLGDSCDKHTAELEGLKSGHASHDAAQGKHAKEMDALKSDLETVKAGHEKHAGVVERVQYLEKLLGDGMDKHSQELQSLKDAHAKHAAAHGKYGRYLDELRADTRHASLEERVACLEQQLGDTSDAQSREVQSLKEMHGKNTAAHGKLSQEFESLKAAQGQHATLAERVECIERTIYDSSDQQAKELATLRSAHAKHAADFGKHTKETGNMLASHGALQQRVEELGQLVTATSGQNGEELQRLHARVTEEVAGLRAQHGPLPEKLSCLERRLSDSTERHSRELQSLRDAHDLHKQDLSDSNDKHGTVDSRLLSMERLLGENSDRHTRELKTLKDNHSRHAKDLQDVKDGHAQHTSHPERLEMLEKKLNEAAEEHLSQMLALKEAHRRHDTTQGKCTKDLEALRQAHSQHASLEDRVNLIENLVNDAAENHKAEVVEMQKRLEMVLGRLDNDGTARERLNSALRDGLAQERNHRETHHASLQERMGSLETMLTGGLDKHARELAATKDAHQQFIKDSSAREVHHGTLAERVEKLEKTVVENGCRQEKELRAAYVSVEAVNRRLNMIKEVWAEDTPRVPAKGF